MKVAMRARCTLLVTALLLVFPSPSRSDGLDDLPPIVGAPAGTLSGSLEVSELGSATYSISLSVPPGTQGVQPSLAIVYGGGGERGILGARFALNGLSVISRCSRTAQQGGIDPVDFDDNDQFCLDGQHLLRLSEGNYSLENSTDASIYRYNIGAADEYWTIWYKNGTVSKFGSSDATRRASINQGDRAVLSWLLEFTRDRNGNHYTVQYAHDRIRGESVPLRIDYTSNEGAGLLPFNSVRFEYSDNPTIIPSYIEGREFSSIKHLRAVRMMTGEEEAWHYDIGWETPAPSLIERVRSIKVCDPSGACLPETTFQWGAQDFSAEFSAPFVSTPPWGAPDANCPLGYPILSGDWNGDGLSDIATSCLQGSAMNTARGPGQFVRYHTAWPDPNRDSRYPWSWFPTFIGDWNGDGKLDIGRVRQNDIILYRSGESPDDGSPPTYTMQVYAVVPNPPSVTLHEHPMPIVADFNGDGKSDLFRQFDIGAPGYIGQVWLSGGDYSQGFFAPSWGMSRQYCPSGYCPVYAGDFDGDGTAGLLIAGEDGIYLIHGGNGSNLFNTASFHPILSAAQGLNSIDQFPIVVGDWNQDGFTDFGRVTQTGIALCLVTGTTTPATCTEIPVLSPAQGYSSDLTNPIVVADFNRDGFPDIFRAGSDNVPSTVIYLQNGRVVGSQIIPNSEVPGAPWLKDDLVVGDWNGDGFPDLMRRVGAQLKVVTAPTNLAGSVVRIVNGLGAITDLEYKPMTDNSVYTRGVNADIPSADLEPSTEVIARIRTTDSSGNVSSTSYKYETLRAVLGSTMCGFKVREEINDQTGIRTRTTFHQLGQFNGMPYKTEVFAPSGARLSLREDTWNHLDFGSGQYTNYIGTSLERKWDLNGIEIDNVTVTRTYNQGNTDLLVEEVTRPNGYLQRSEMTYRNDFSVLLSRQLQTMTVTKRRSADATPTTRRTVFTYDRSSPAAEHRGLLLAETIEPGTAYQSRKNYQYDRFGNIIQTTIESADGLVRTSSKEYDPTGRFMIAETNQLGHTVRFAYDPRHGLVSRKTDVNGNSVVATFDAFGRPLTSVHPDGAVERKLQLLVDSADAPAGAAYYERSDSNLSAPSFTYYDSLGREIQKRVVGFDGREIVVDRVYNERGQLTHVSEPRFISDPPLWNVSEYDLLGRLRVQTAADGSSNTMVYDGFTTVTINSLGQQSTRTVTVLGELASVTDAHGYSLSYRYDNYGSPLEVRESSRGIATQMFYDQLGRRTRILDPNSGESTFTYNGFGELLTTTNSKGETIRNTYDVLGRLVARQSPEGEVRWEYDSAAHGVGLPARVIGLNGYSESFTYDSLGRTVSETQSTLGKSFTVGYEFDSRGRQVRLTYPSGFGVRYLYSDAGYLSEVRGSQDNKLFWRGEVQNARGQFVEQTLGNGVALTHQYSPTTGHLNAIYSVTGATPVQDLAFEFDSLGNLKQRMDRITGNVERFEYDQLNRLVRSQVGDSSAGAVSVSYDPLGNIVSRSDVGQYLYGMGNAGPNAVTSISGAKPNTYTYDAAGNRITSSDGEIQYSSNGKPIRLTKGATTLSFELSPSDQRVAQIRSESGTVAEQKIYVNGIYEFVTRQGVTDEIHYVNGGQGAIVMVTNTRRGLSRELDSLRDIISSGGQRPPPVGIGHLGTPTQRNPYSIRYLLLDHLGSVQTVTNEDGDVVEVRSYDPWGLARDPLTWTALATPRYTPIDRGFTGHEMLNEVELVHMNGRVYDPVIGRFVSPDPFVQAPENLQNLNRYSYVLNNPLSYSDPSGYFFKKLAKLFKRALPMIVSTAIFFATSGWGSAVMGWMNITAQSFAGYGANLIAGVSASISGFMGQVGAGLVSGGSLPQVLRGSLRDLPFTALKSALANGIGTAFSPGDACTSPGSLYDAFGSSHAVAKAVAHGLVGGSIGAIQGQSFSSAFLAGSVGDISAGMSNHPIVNLLAGGTASAIAGGKFEDGVMQAAIVFLYNHRGEHGGRAKESDDQATRPRDESKSMPNFIYEELGQLGESHALSSFLNLADKIGRGVTFFAPEAWKTSQASFLTAFTPGPTPMPIRIGALRAGVYYGALTAIGNPKLIYNDVAKFRNVLSGPNKENDWKELR